MKVRAAYNRILEYAFAFVLVVVVAAGLSLARDALDRTVVALLFLIPVGGATARWGLGPGITAALSAFLSFNYLFIAPYYTFTVHRAGDLGVLMVFLVVAGVISQLVARAQAGGRAAAAREREATQLYELSTALAGARDKGKIAATLGEQLLTSLECESVVIQLAGSSAPPIELPSGAVAPLRSPELVSSVQGIGGALGEIRVWRSRAPLTPAEERLVKTFAGHGALALERAALAEAEDRAKLLEESDRFKSSLLSSVSHDLRTPLATIKAAASSLRTGEVSWDAPARAELLAAIDDETDHLNMLVGNLLDMSRIESGALRPQRRWNVLLEVVQSVLARTRRLTSEHQIVLDVPDDLPLVPVDFVQMGQVFSNLLSNSVKFAPPGTTVRLQASVLDPDRLLVRVSNEGPPVPKEHLAGIFDRFHEMPSMGRQAGTGLGLSICKAIIEAHDGKIWAENLPQGFAFHFTLPLHMNGEAPQELPQETA